MVIPKKKASTKKATVKRSAVKVEQKINEKAVVETENLETNSSRSRPDIFDHIKGYVVPAMMKEFSYGNVMQVPKINKIVLNMSVGEGKDNPKAIDGAVSDLTTLSGQKPVITKAKKAIASFKLREGQPIGVTVTLRGDKMGYFLERLLHTALPRIRDFRGVSRSSFDGRGNYSLGIKEQVIFPEIDYNSIDKIRGFQVTIATSADTDGEAAKFLELIGMPFVRAV
jgi:large subunit ribosomal protein L5